MTGTGGIVLCGGQSKRMGRQKAWLPFGPEVMLQRVVRILSGIVSPVVVVAAPGQEIPPLPESIAIVRDDIPGKGPLQGLAAGLKALGDRCQSTYLSSCDVPLLQPAFVKRVIEMLGSFQAAVPFVEGRCHPLAAVYRLEVRDVVLHLLESGRLRPTFVFDEAPTRIIQASELADVDPLFLSLRNLNSPLDYEAALHEAGFTPGETADPGHGA